jgi:transcription elongation factor Elf1
MMATATKAIGFKTLVCPFCGNHGEETAITMDLASLDVTCSSCDAEFTVDDAVSEAKAHLAEWERLARWVEASRTV